MVNLNNQIDDFALSLAAKRDHTQYGQITVYVMNLPFPSPKLYLTMAWFNWRE